MRQLLSMIAEFHLKISQTSVEDFRNRWLNLYFTWMSLGKPTVYFVRTDFVNAFGSIKQVRFYYSNSLRMRNQLNTDVTCCLGKTNGDYQKT